MTKLETMDRVSSWADVYGEMDLLIRYIDEDGDEVEGLYSEFTVGEVLFEIIGYICPSCFDVVYLDDYDDECVDVCPVCEFEFREGIE